MPKSRDDFTEAQLRSFHSRLAKADSKDERAAIYKDMNALPQAVAQWFRRMSLAPLGAATEAKAKVKGPGKTKAAGGKAASAGKKRGRPKGSKNETKAPAQGGGTGTSTPRSRRGSSLSTEAKEILIRLLDKFLAD